MIRVAQVRAALPETVQLGYAVKANPAPEILKLLASLGSCFDVASVGEIAIPPKDLPFVFDKFYRVEANNRMAKGTGLGLSLVKHIIEAHNGTISVASDVGKGSRFTILLPLARKAAGAPDSETVLRIKALIRWAENRIFRDSPNAFICVSSFNAGARRLYEELGFTDASDLKDRYYFHSLYVRSPGGILVECTSNVSPRYSSASFPDSESYRAIPPGR